jgi:hypothetical protein
LLVNAPGHIKIADTNVKPAKWAVKCEHCIENELIIFGFTIRMILVTFYWFTKIKRLIDIAIFLVKYLILVILIGIFTRTMGTKNITKT